MYNLKKKEAKSQAEQGMLTTATCQLGKVEQVYIKSEDTILCWTHLSYFIILSVKYAFKTCEILKSGSL